MEAMRINVFPTVLQKEDTVVKRTTVHKKAFKWMQYAVPNV